MRNLVRILVAACAAASLLAFASGAAYAHRAIEIRPNGVINTGRISINEPLRFATIACEVTVLLNYVREVQKASARRLPEGTIGVITEVRTRNCVDNFMVPWIVTFLVEPRRPIMMRYDAFLGALPNITGLLITALGVGVRLVSRNTNCLFEGDLPFLVFERNGRQRFDEKLFLENRLNFVEGNCERESFIEIAGTLTIVPPITVTLL